MGEPVTVIEKPTSRPDYVRFETNRSFTGMGHESYHVDDEIHTNRPGDVVAEALFATGKVEEVHVYSQMVTVKLSSPDSSGLKEVLEGLYTYYKPGVEVPTPEMFGAEG